MKCTTTVHSYITDQGQGDSGHDRDLPDQGRELAQGLLQVAVSDLQPEQADLSRFLQHGGGGHRSAHGCQGTNFVMNNQRLYCLSF